MHPLNPCNKNSVWQTSRVPSTVLASSLLALSIAAAILTVIATYQFHAGTPTIVSLSTVSGLSGIAGVVVIALKASCGNKKESPIRNHSAPRPKPGEVSSSQRSQPLLDPIRTRQQKISLIYTLMQKEKYDAIVKALAGVPKKNWKDLFFTCIDNFSDHDPHIERFRTEQADGIRYPDLFEYALVQTSGTFRYQMLNLILGKLEKNSLGTQEIYCMKKYFPQLTTSSLITLILSCCDQRGSEELFKEVLKINPENWMAQILTQWTKKAFLPKMKATNLIHFVFVNCDNGDLIGTMLETIKPTVKLDQLKFECSLNDVRFERTSLLIFSILKSNLPLIKKILALCPSLIKQKVTFKSPGFSATGNCLYAAIECNSTEIMNALLEHTPDLQKKSVQVMDHKKYLRLGPWEFATFRNKEKAIQFYNVLPR